MANSAQDHQGEDDYLYCYCMASAGIALAMSDLDPVLGGSPPQAVEVGQLQAVVSRVPSDEYSETRLQVNCQQMDWVKAAVLGHERVVEGCLRQTEVVPMKFCTLFESESDLVTGITNQHGEVISKLLDLKGKQEWGVRLSADSGRLRQHLLEHHPEIVATQKGIASKPAGAAYFVKKRLEDRLVQLAEQSRANAAEHVYGRLAAAATRAALLKPSGQAPAGSEPALNAAFLVTQEQLGKLLSTLQEIESEMPWLIGEPSGPWPPYNFV